MNKLYFHDDRSRVEALGELCDLPIDQGYFYELQWKLVKDSRTSRQNRAMHKYFGLLAGELNGAGLDMRKFLKPGIEIPWNAGTIKNNVWRPVQIIVTGKESTTQLKTDEPSKVYNVISRHISQEHGIYVPWPSFR